MLLDIAARRADFLTLHNAGYFLLPTAWDVGSAKRLESLGYAGFATTIQSFTWTLGRNATEVTRDDALAQMRQLVDATEIAVNADYGSGFATNARELTENVHMAIDTGIAAFSICDRVGEELFSLTQAAAQIQACRNAIDISGTDVLLVARTDVLLAGTANVSAAIERLTALADAGADVLCLPGVADSAAIKVVVAAVTPKPLDIQIIKPGLTAIELGQLGVRRISVGETFAEVAWASFVRATEQLIDHGTLAPEGCLEDGSIVAPGTSGFENPNIESKNRSAGEQSRR